MFPDTLAGTSLPGPQTLQNRRRGEAVGYRPDRSLECAQSGAALGAQAAVRLADVIAAPRQELLQLVALVAREHALMARPRLHDRPAAAQPVGEMADRKR